MGQWEPSGGRWEAEGCPFIAGASLGDSGHNLPPLPPWPGYTGFSQDSPRRPGPAPRLLLAQVQQVGVWTHSGTRLSAPGPPSSPSLPSPPHLSELSGRLFLFIFLLSLTGWGKGESHL